jgi:hypothetical protein
MTVTAERAGARARLKSTRFSARETRYSSFGAFDDEARQPQTAAKLLNLNTQCDACQQGVGVEKIVENDLLQTNCM